MHRIFPPKKIPTGKNKVICIENSSFELNEEFKGRYVVDLSFQFKTVWLARRKQPSAIFVSDLMNAFPDAAATSGGKLHEETRKSFTLSGRRKARLFTPRFHRPSENKSSSNAHNFQIWPSRSIERNQGQAVYRFFPQSNPPHFLFSPKIHLDLNLPATSSRPRTGKKTAFGIKKKKKFPFPFYLQLVFHVQTHIRCILSLRPIFFSTRF